MRFSTRPAIPTDEPFRRALDAEVRGQSIGGGLLPAAVLGPLLELQYHARIRGYRAAYPDGTEAIVEQDGVPVGELWTARSGQTLTLVHVALIGAVRGQGLGRAVIAAVQAEARAAGARVQLSVAHDNPALALYRRCGFELVSRDEVRCLLSWTPVEVTG